MEENVSTEVNAEDIASFDEGWSDTSTEVAVPSVGVADSSPKGGTPLQSLRDSSPKGGTPLQSLRDSSPKGGAGEETADTAREAGGETQQAESETTSGTETGAGERQGMFLEFIEEFPDVKAKDIPREVWDDVKSGAKLTTAYYRYLVRQKGFEDRERENRAKAAGSVSSRGEKVRRSDPFDEGWDEL